MQGRRVLATVFIERRTMKDLTIIYYTANLINDFFAENVRNGIIEVTNGDVPIISISQKPIDFGRNICCPDMVPSIYNIYKQILIGSIEAKTKYVACAEDDCIYVPEHFQFRPPDDTFCYNTNNIMIDYRVGYIYKERMNMCMCVANRELMVDTLTKRFKKYPELLPREKLKGFSEPGRHEHYLGLPPVKRAGFKTIIPCLTLNHRPSQGGVRRIMPHQKTCLTHEYWGNGIDLWRKVHG